MAWSATTASVLPSGLNVTREGRKSPVFTRRTAPVATVTAWISVPSARETRKTISRPSGVQAGSPAPPALVVKARSVPAATSRNQSSIVPLLSLTYAIVLPSGAYTGSNCTYGSFVSCVSLPLLT